MNRLYHLLLTFLCVILFCPANSQDTATRRYIDIGKISLNSHLSQTIVGSYISPESSAAKEYPHLDFNKKSIRGLISSRHVTDKALIRFQITNSADTAKSIWFFPGFYFWHIQLYLDNDGLLQPLPSILPTNADSIGYRLISLAAHDSAIIVAELGAARTYLNRITPQLISTDFLPLFIAWRHGTTSRMNLITYIFCGLLLMMILYSMAMFFQGANREFLYYSAYAFFLGLMLFLKTIYTFHSSWISFFQEEYLDFIMQNAGIGFYMVFMQKYLGTRTNHPVLHKLYNAGVLVLILSSLGFTYFHFLTQNFIVENMIENVTKILLLLWVAAFLVYAVRSWRDNMLRYLFWGNLCLFFFSMLSLLFTLDVPLSQQMPGIFGSSLLHYEIGLFLELVFFLAALNHKNRKQLIYQARERERLKAENLMKEYEKELAVYKAQQQERERISADMHDELGAGMTAIRLMSEIARNKMKENTPVEVDKISQSADEVLNKMNAIIWSMNSGNDTVDNLVSYIRSYALEYFESTPVNCRVFTPEDIDPIELSGDKRRNIFLCVKETLNNALKHSKASEIKINFQIDDKLEIRIADNGVGADMQSVRQFGNGLKNINKRMTSIGGSYTMNKQDGTITVLTLPL
jgi:signal transduction histidine kinase